MHKPSGKITLAFGIFLLLLAVLLGAVYYKWQQSPRDLAAAVDPSVLRIVPRPIPVPEARLTDMHGKPFGRQDLLGHWTFLYFGYTLCPDVCPTELSALAGLAEILREKGVQAPWQMVFVSVDPERDTPELLSKFVTYFDPGIIAATGAQTELRIMAQPLGVGWEKAALPTANDTPSDSYLINHTTSILLINPQGEMVGVYPTPHEPEAMAQAFLTVIE